MEFIYYIIKVLLYVVSCNWYLPFSSLIHAVPTERVQYIQIRPGETGHSYASVFSTCMDGNVQSIAVRDPYIRARHQLHNFVRFCELVVKKCHKLREITLTTGKDQKNEVYINLGHGYSNCL